jgi:hypothetical protein
VRITISHDRSKEEVMQAVDRSLHETFQGVGTLPLRLVVEQKNWQGSTLMFSLAARLGVVSIPIKGTIEVTDRDLTIDVDLGLLERLVPAKTARDLVSSRFKGLLK